MFLGVHGCRRKELASPDAFSGVTCRGAELGGSRGAPVTSTHWMGLNTTPL